MTAMVRRMRGSKAWRCTSSYFVQTRRYWIAITIAAAAAALIDVQAVNPIAKYTISLHLFGKCMVAFAAWYLGVKIFCPYSDLAASMDRRDLVRVVGDVGVRIAAALIVLGVWSSI